MHSSSDLMSIQEKIVNYSDGKSSENSEQQYRIDAGFGLFRYQELDGVLYVHYDAYEWSPSIYKKMKYLWSRVIKHAKELGYSTFYTIIPDNEPMIKKFDKMFGFYEVAHVDNMILLARDL